MSINRSKLIVGITRDLLLTGEENSLIILTEVRKQVPDATLSEVRQARNLPALATY